MAPPRRVRDEALTLRRTGLPDIELFRARESLYLHQFPTQGRFQVAPNAQTMAFSTPGKDLLTIVRRDGKMGTVENIYQDQFRISPDGRYLLAMRYYAGALRVASVDLHTFQESLTIVASNPIWLEVCADGLLVLEYKYVNSIVQHILHLMPWTGEPRVIADIDSYTRRFSCAKAGKNIAYFPRGAIWSIAEPGAEPVRIAELGQDITNAEMSPDGRSLIVLTDRDAYRYEDGKLVQTLGLPKAHTVWFSQDGSQFVVANAYKAIWQRGEKKAELSADEKSPIRTARFAPRSPWIMVARGADAVRWNPESDNAETIAVADENQEMLGVDVFAGGVVIWTGTTWQIEDWRKKRD